MTLEQTLQNEIKESNRWNEIEKDESTYRRDLKKGEKTKRLILIFDLLASLSSIYSMLTYSDQRI